MAAASVSAESYGSEPGDKAQAARTGPDCYAGREGEARSGAGGGACVPRGSVVPGPLRTAHARFGADVAGRAVWSYAGLLELLKRFG